MRGKLSEQDLTNYALNDGLNARERLYVESMLGAAEECREDVYRLLDLSQMLQEGFEQQEDAQAATLTAAQRERLLTAEPRFTLRPLLRQAAATLSLAACVAFMLTVGHSGLSPHRGYTVASVSSEVSRMVGEAMASEEPNIASYVTPPTVWTDDSGSYIQTSGESMPIDGADSEGSGDMGCTPPTSAGM